MRSFTLLHTTKLHSKESNQEQNETVEPVYPVGGVTTPRRQFQMTKPVN